MRRTISLVAVIALCAVHTFAAPLTRPEATRVLQKTKDFKEFVDAPWSIEGLRIPAHIQSGLNSGVLRRGSGGTELVTPLHRAVSSITGIAEVSPSEKTVEFTWYISDLTATIADATHFDNADHPGMAAMKLYDDGWRVTGLQLTGAMGGIQWGKSTRPLAGESGLPVKPAPPRKMSDVEALKQITSDLCDDAVLWENAMYSPHNAGPDGARSAVEMKKLFPVSDQANFRGTDPWGRSYRFAIKNNGATYTFTCLGKDGKLGTSDDTVFANAVFIKAPVGVKRPECPPGPR